MQSLTQAGAIDNSKPHDLSFNYRKVGVPRMWRRTAITWIGLLALGSAESATPGPSAAVRTVQLITVGSAPPPVANDEARSTVTGPADIPTTAATEFAVHDLSRQWVEFRLARAFAMGAPTPYQSEDVADPFAHVGVAQPEVPPFARGEPAIAVPLWMRGATFPSAAHRFAPGCDESQYRPAGFLSRNDEVRRRTYYGVMANIACEFGIPVGLFDAMIIRESRYNAAAVSAKSAFGLAQLMPQTAAGLGVNRYNIEENLRGGAKYLRQQLDRFGKYHLALAAYNAGPGRVANGRVPAIPETAAYVDDILKNWFRLSGAQTVQRAPIASNPRFRSAAVTTF